MNEDYYSNVASDCLLCTILYCFARLNKQRGTSEENLYVCVGVWYLSSYKVVHFSRCGIIALSPPDPSPQPLVPPVARFRAEMRCNKNTDWELIQDAYSEASGMQSARDCPQFEKGTNGIWKLEKLKT
jgi:hypothetical protein